MGRSVSIRKAATLLTNLIEHPGPPSSTHRTCRPRGGKGRFMLDSASVGLSVTASGQLLLDLCAERTKAAGPLYEQGRCT